MRGTAWRWAVAIVIAAAAGVWQERSGPTYPVRGAVSLGGSRVPLALERSHETGGGQPVSVAAPDRAIAGEVAFRRFPTGEPFQIVTLHREGDRLTAVLPAQPAAGKLEYQVRLTRGGENAVFPSRPAITRFKGEVPVGVLLPHVLAMFVGLVFAARAALEGLRRDGNAGPHVWAALGFFVVGGFGLGPFVQHYAFGEWWAGVPHGWDLTDNKTLLLVLAWLAAAWACRGGRRPRAAVVAAALVTLAVFAIPHSAWGSQLDWSKVAPPATTSSSSQQ